MSWQTYIDDHLLGDMGNGRYLTSAAIIGQDGNVWAQSDTFPALKPQEISKIVHGFVDPGEIAQHGLYIGGAKYMVIQGEPGAVIRGKKGSAGVTIKKTNSALVFGIYDDPVTAGECNVNVEGLGDYLINAGI